MKTDTPLKANKVVVYVTPAMRTKLREMAFERYAGEGGYLSVGRLIREMLESVTGTPPATEPSRPRRQFARIKSGGSGSRLTTLDGVPATTPAAAHAEAA